MRAAVIDVGSNTVRLLVAEQGRRGLETILTERRHLGLAADIEREGLISNEKLEQVTELAARFASQSRASGADQVDVVVTAPGRQAGNADQLELMLVEATGVPVRILTAEDEGRLAFNGALGTSRSVAESVGVCDVGGGSTQVMVGTTDGPAWLRSLDVGSLRLTERHLLDDPPSPDQLAAIERDVAHAFESVTPPLPLGALATGGTARALRQIVARQLDETQFSEALRILALEPADQLAVSYGFPAHRARTLAAGAIILREAHRRLGVRLEVAKGGVREGVVLELFAAAEAAA